MDGDMISESLDSLWFSSNVLSQPSPPPPQSTALNPIQPPRKIDQPLNSELVLESPDTLVISPEETITEPEQQKCRKEPDTVKRRKKSNDKPGRKRFHKLHREEMVCLVSTLVTQHRYHYQSCTGVAAVSEDLAMKEHLKSWAHAVGCTVK